MVRLGIEQSVEEKGLLPGYDDDIMIFQTFLFSGLHVNCQVE